MPLNQRLYGATMTYENSQMKLDELIGYFRDEKINLIPPFQRGKVWSPLLRRKLLENIVRGKPIPAIFMYKTEDGSKYSYNILDGKQRLESILLFVGSGRPDLKIANWRKYFFRSHSGGNFKINVALPGEKRKTRSFAQLDDGLVRDFREYKIPTIEIDMAEEGAFKELIDLFIDINQYGVKVKRFDIVRTMKDENPLLSNTFDLIAIKQKRGRDNFYKTKDCDFTSVLNRLQVVSAVSGDGKEERFQERVDRMWERLLEIVLFIRSGQHRTLAQILNVFTRSQEERAKITSIENSRLRSIFGLLKSCYPPSIRGCKMMTDQTHFYTLVTSIHAHNMIERYGAKPLKSKLILLARIIDKKAPAPVGKGESLKKYLELFSKQTTHPSRRKDRQDIFAELVEAVQPPPE